MGEDKNGLPITRLGDQPTQKSTATETVQVIPSANAATQVQTIVDMKPTEEPQPKITKEKIEIRDLLADPIEERVSIKDLLSSPTEEPKPVQSEPKPVAISAPIQPTIKPEAPSHLDAHFIRDTIPDGSKISAEQQFVQVWTLRNPGPIAWPAGCSVRHVGGDNMLNLDNSRPLSQAELSEASESNVIGRSVEPGEEISFRVVMKAPKREGTAISYWRLKKADGTPFGHRLWCDINVVSPPITPIAPVSDPISDAASTPDQAVEASSPSSNTTPYQRFQQAKLERLRALQKASIQGSRTRQLEKEVQKGALEQLRKLKVEMDEKDRENLSRIQQVRKAAVERLLENRRKEQEKKTAEVEKATVETTQAPIEENTVETAPIESSGMIFPKLDKESPASSAHEATVSPPVSPETKIEDTVSAPTSEHSDEEFFEDAESVEIRSVSSDEGFLTDEEYDILDASDEEMP